MVYLKVVVQMKVVVQNELAVEMKVVVHIEDEMSYELYGANEYCLSKQRSCLNE